MNISCPTWFSTQFFAEDGVTPLANGRLMVYKAGTTDEAVTYDNAGVAQTNPRILDIAGRVELFVNVVYSYKFRWHHYDSTQPNGVGALVGEADNVYGAQFTTTAVPTVYSVNGQIGDVVLDASDVGALPAGGTAVDSDKLDGHDSTYFATDSALGGKVSKTGDYMSGAIVQQPLTNVSIINEVKSADGNSSVQTSVLNGSSNIGLISPNGITILEPNFIQARDTSGEKSTLSSDKITRTSGASDAILLIPFDVGTTKTLATTSDIPEQETKNLSTGLLTWSGTKFTLVDATHVAIASLTGQVVDTAGAITAVTYAGNANILDSFVGSTSNTYFSIDSTGALVQRSTYPTPTQLRAEIYVGFSVHAPVGTITSVIADPEVAFNEMSQVRDLLGALGIINKGVEISANGANLLINRSTGYFYDLGIGFATSTTDTSRKQINAGTGITFQYRTQNGTATSDLTSIECGFYDNGGTRTALTGTKYTNQRIYVSPTGLTRIAYGQVQYNSMALAIAGVSSEAYTPYPPFETNFSLVGILSVKSTATALNDATQCVFNRVSIFGESTGASSGSATTTLQQAYDNSTEPEILTDATRGALSLKRGSSADTDAVLEIINGAGDIVGTIKGNGDLTIGSLTYTPTGEFISAGDTHTSYLQLVTQNKSNAVGASTDIVVSNDLATDSTYYGDFGINSSTFTGTGSFQLANATYLYSSNGDLVLGSFTANDIRFVVNNQSTDAMLIDSNGRVNVSTSTATRAGLNIGAFGVVPSSPADGDIFKGAADSLKIRMATNTRTIPFLETAQSFTAAQTMTSTLAVTSTITGSSTVTGRALVLTQQANTPSGTTYTWTLTSGNALTLTLTSSTNNVTVTTASPTAGTMSFISTVGHASAARTVSLTQSGVTWIYGGVSYATTVNLGTTAISKKVLYEMYWVSTTVCMVERMASDDGITYLDNSITSQTKVGDLTIDKVATGTLFEVKNNGTSKAVISDTGLIVTNPVNINSGAGNSTYIQGRGGSASSLAWYVGKGNAGSDNVELAVSDNSTISLQTAGSTRMAVNATSITNSVATQCNAKIGTTGDLECPIIYYGPNGTQGNATTDNSWRTYVDASNNLITQRRVSGTWVTKQTITG